jgi:two-component system, response regulator
MTQETEDQPYLLLADDSEEDADLTARVLRGGKLIEHVVHFYDGSQLLDYVFSDSFSTHPLLLLLDLDMPKTHGLEVLRKMKSDGDKKHIPVVVMSGCSDEGVIKQTYELGVNGFVRKHTQFEKFKEEILHVGKFWLKTNYYPGFCNSRQV